MSKLKVIKIVGGIAFLSSPVACSAGVITNSGVVLGSGIGLLVAGFIFFVIGRFGDG